MCSALYVTCLDLATAQLRLTANRRSIHSRYPINFVVKHPRFPFLKRSPALGLLKPAGTLNSSETACFQIGVTRKWRRSGNSKHDLVELIGIEPMTPCLQSRCSPN